MPTQLEVLLKKAKKLEKENPQNDVIIQIYMDIATQYYNQQNIEKAKDVLEKVIELKNDCIEAYNNLAILFENDYFKEYDKAKENYLKAIDLKKDDAETYNNLAILLKNDYFKDYDKAKEYYLKAIELKKDFKEAYYNLANLLSNDYFKDYDKAKEYCEKAIELKKDDAEAYFNLALLLTNDYFKEYDKAKEYYEIAIELNKDYADAYNNLALLLTNDYFKEYDKAKEYYEKAIELKKDDAEAYYGLAWLLSEDYFKEYDKAKEYYEKAIELKNDYADAYNNLANLLSEDYFKEYDKAKEYYEKAIELNKDDADAYNNLATLYFNNLNDLNLASYNYLKAIELSKENILIRENIRELADTKKDPFINKLEIRKVRHLENLNVEINNNELKHLALTGKNGSGKTSVLNECKVYLNKILEMPTETLFSEKGREEFLSPKDYNLKFDVSPSLLDMRIKYESRRFIVAHFPARRELKLEALKELKPVKFDSVNSITDELHKRLLSYLFHLDYQHKTASFDKDEKRANEIKLFLDRFFNVLKSIDERIENWKFNTEFENYQLYLNPAKPYEKFNFEQLADGFSSIFFLISDIMLRMVNKTTTVFDLPGIVLIDEPEAHLHIEMQKKVMPALIQLFPKIQFIVATHSPFIVNSMDNTVIYDLHTNQRLENAHNFSASSLVKHHFEIPSEQSEIVNTKIKEFENLMSISKKKKLTDKQQEQLVKLDFELSEISQVLSPDNYLKFKNIKKQISK